MVADGDAHHRGAEVEEEHRKLKPESDADEAVVEEVDGGADQCNQCGADEETGCDPVHAFKWYAEHSQF